jgi:hypothetical protein
MKYAVIAAGLLLLALGMPAGAQVDKAPEPLAQRVAKAIDKGVKYLRDQEGKNGKKGSWEVDPESLIDLDGGWTSLALLALMNSGVSPKDETVKRGLDYLRNIKASKTYVVALQTMAFAEAGYPEDLERIKNNVKWLLDARVRDKDGSLKGWYYNKGAANIADNSNTQYAVLGLQAGRQAGVKIIEPKDWNEIRDFYLSTQKEEGGWIYAAHYNNFPTLTMTSAGLCGLLISGLEMNEGRETFLKDGTAKNCGVYKENKAIKKAFGWINQQTNLFNLSQNVFYNLYGLERVGRFSGERFFGNRDWYREGCEFLLDNKRCKQQPDGSWTEGGRGGKPVICTSFALLFLSKGRTPVLISKMVHGPWPRKDNDHDWNNDRNDLRHLVDFASKQLFKRQPLAWQVFDAMRAPVKNDPKLLQLTSELLQSPVAYITGHRSPKDRFTGTEKKLLQQFIENGGFILAEACCGRKEFDEGFHALVKELWPREDGKDPLEDLEPGHPVWKSHFLVPPGSFKLKGVKRGCKTVLIYSPEDLSCYWESNKHEDKKFQDGKGVLAFRLGANIIAYATGMEPPRPRLDLRQLTDLTDPVETPPRGYLKVAQLKYTGDWQPAPRAMGNLMAYLKKKAGLNVALETTPMPVDNASVIDYKFLYLHGRGKVEYSDEQLKKLRFNLETGGLLLADACCGNKVFDESFRKILKQLFPKHKLERIPAKDELFSKELNGYPGEGLSAKNIRCRTERPDGKGPKDQFENMPPWLEGIKIDGRWVVIYSKYDIGCALEQAQSSDCLGYHPDSALRLAAAAVLYTLTP